MTAGLAGRVAQRLAELTPEGQPVLLAVSGGPDSRAMLDLLHATVPIHRRPLLVGHVDHGIHPDSAVGRSRRRRRRRAPWTPLPGGHSGTRGRGE